MKLAEQRGDGPEWNACMHAYGRVGAGPCHSQLCAVPGLCAPISGNQICTFPGNSSWHDACRTCTLPGPPSSSSPPPSRPVADRWIPGGTEGSSEDGKSFSRSVGRAADHHDLDAVVPSVLARAGRASRGTVWLVAWSAGASHDACWVLRSGYLDLNGKLATGQGRGLVIHPCYGGVSAGREGTAAVQQQTLLPLDPVGVGRL